MVGLEAVTTGLVEEDPPATPGQDDGKLAARSRAGGQLGQGPTSRLLGQLFDGHLLEELGAERAGCRLETGLQAGVPDGHARDREAGAPLVVGGQQAIRVGHQHPASGRATAGLHLRDGTAGGSGGVVGSPQRSRGSRPWTPGGRVPPPPSVVAGGVTVTGVVIGAVGPTGGPGAWQSGRAGHPSSTPAGHPGGGFGGPQQSGFGQVGRVGKTGRLTHDHTNARAPLATRRQLLDPPVVEDRGGRGAVLGEHLGELTAMSQGFAENALEHGGFDHFWPPPPDRATADGSPRRVSRMVPAWPRSPACRPASRWR